MHSSKIIKLNYKFMFDYKITSKYKTSFYYMEFYQNILHFFLHVKYFFLHLSFNFIIKKIVFNWNLISIFNKMLKTNYI